jgi:Transglycosylase SLT domain
VASFVQDIEKKGERTPGGETSPAGATGVMQVLPTTAASPGFGLRPADPNDPQDVVRLGQDYAKAMLQRYGGNKTLASAAYNAGPGRVDQWIGEFGDPRNGGITDADWTKKIPFDETRGYVGRVAGPTGAPSNPLTVPQAPQASPSPPAGTQPTASAPAAAAAADPKQALALLSLVLPMTHTLTPVDYDPWKLTPKGTTV